MIKLYILVRTDMDSMNAGRVAAQCSHASNYFVKMARDTIEYLENPDDPFVKNFNDWENQTDQGYGTVIVLDGGTEEEIRSMMNRIEFEYLTGAIVDPEYPIKDGDVIHIIPNVFTCAFAFQFDRKDPKLLEGLKLYGKN